MLEAMACGTPVRHRMQAHCRKLAAAPPSAPPDDADAWRECCGIVDDAALRERLVGAVLSARRGSRETSAAARRIFGVDAVIHLGVDVEPSRRPARHRSVSALDLRQWWNGASGVWK